ncbi:hypothetical protein [Comamonas sp. B-9]|uniref:hypothetical protein n=1 Tax=Comamonas sp. B-9 TaxID=1055192 RepID=UPI000395A8BE|nr:hypothetical protein [Comamonas sp. B-9]
MDAAAWGFIGTLVGALTSIGTTWIASTVSRNMQSDKQKEERREKAKDFQRTTLLDLQESIHDVERMFRKVHYEQFKEFAKTDKWGGVRLTDETVQRRSVAVRNTTILLERVENTEIRDGIRSFMQTISKQLALKDLHDAEDLEREMESKFDYLIKDLGAVLRSYY